MILFECGGKGSQESRVTVIAAGSSNVAIFIGGLPPPRAKWEWSKNKMAGRKAKAALGQLTKDVAGYVVRATRRR
jgi:hypothetical protein